MTLGLTTRVETPTGDGLTTGFAVSFQFFEIDVYVAGVLQVNGSDYTISQPGGAGTTGTVNFTTAPANGAAIVIRGNTSLQQQVDLLDVDEFPAESVERALDRVYAAAQEAETQLSKALRTTVSNADLPELDFANNADRIIYVNSSGVPEFRALTDPTLTVDAAPLDGNNTWTGTNTFENDVSIDRVGDTADASFVLNVDAAQNITEFLRTAGNNRWAIGKDNVAEGGSDAGSDFFIRNYDDAGALLTTPFKIQRSDGDVIIPFMRGDRIYFVERATAGGDFAGRGQLWVKDDAPNNLYFTDDTGQDVQITNNGVLNASDELQTQAEQATTSGTEFDFTSIPAGTTMIQVIFEEVELSGTDSLLVQLGDSGGIETTGYSAVSGDIGSSAGMIIRGGSSAVMSGVMTLIHMGGNSWVNGHGYKVTSTASFEGGGAKTLSGELDRVRLTRSGSNTFSAGSVRVIYM